MPTFIEMTGSPKGAWPAATRLEQIAFHRLRLYRLYDDDAECIGEIQAFHRSWGPQVLLGLRGPDENCLPDLDDADSVVAARIGEPEAAAYLSQLGTLAAKLGLGRIPAVGDPKPIPLGYLPSGVAQAHRYLIQLVRALRAEQAIPELMELGHHQATATALAAAGPPVPPSPVSRHSGPASPRWTSPSRPRHAGIRAPSSFRPRVVASAARRR